MSVLQSCFFFRPSRWVVGIFLIGITTAISAAAIIPIPVILRGLLIIILVSIFYYSYRQQRQQPAAIPGLLFHPSGEVAIVDSESAIIDRGRVLYCFISPYLSTVVIAGSRRRYNLLVMPDSLSTNDYRQLRIRLQTIVVNAENRAK